MFGLIRSFAFLLVFGLKYESAKVGFPESWAIYISLLLLPRLIIHMTVGGKTKSRDWMKRSRNAAMMRVSFGTSDSLKLCAKFTDSSALVMSEKLYLCLWEKEPHQKSTVQGVIRRFTPLHCSARSPITGVNSHVRNSGMKNLMQEHIPFWMLRNNSYWASFFFLCLMSTWTLQSEKKSFWHRLMLVAWKV